MTLTPVLALQLLTLLLVANGTPVLAKRLLAERWAWPLDGGRLFFDGRPLLGPSKTWRGVVLATVACMLTAQLLGFTWMLGLLFGLASMLGDALSSFTKRRLSIPSSGLALGIDQIPEALIPLLVCRAELELDGWSILLLVMAFVVGELLVSRLMFRLGIRETPY